MNLFIFHPDLRLFDNTSLIKQIKTFKKVTPIFIFPPTQIDPKINKYFSHNSVQFMIESLKELSADISSLGGKLYFFKGENIDILNQLLKNNKINSVGFNLDYTPYAKTRDNLIKNWAEKHKIEVVAEEDYTMYEMMNDQLVNEKTKKPYLVFTPFKNFCMKNFKVPKPNAFKNFVFETSNKLLDDVYSFK